jgi:hypothetical protein
MNSFSFFSPYSLSNKKALARPELRYVQRNDLLSETINQNIKAYTPECEE